MTIQQQVDSIIAEMKSLKNFDDEVFISFFEKVGEMQERISSSGAAEGLSEADIQDCSERLAKAFDELKGRLSFCTL